MFLKLILIPWFYHPDIKSQYFHFQFLKQGVGNIYQYINQNKNQLPYNDTFNYLPLTYFSFGIFNSLISPLMPSDFTNWINDWGEYQNNYSNLPIFLFFLKLPYLILDILIGLILFKLFPDKKVYLFWLFNPFVFYSVFILQNFDIVPVFLTILSYYLLTKNQLKLSFFIFGISVSLKLYSLLLLPLFIIFLKPKPFEIVKYSLISLVPLIITSLPFLNNQYFLSSFIGSGLTQKLFETKLFNIPIFPILYLFIFIYSWLKSPTTLFKNISLIFLLFISTVNFHPQWLLWFYPFFLINSSSSLKSLFLNHLILIPIMLFIFLFDDNYLTWGHLIPLDPLIVNTTSPYNILRFKFLQNPLTFQNYSKIFMALIAIILGYFYEKNSRN